MSILLKAIQSAWTLQPASAIAVSDTRKAQTAQQLFEGIREFERVFGSSAGDRLVFVLPVENNVDEVAALLAAAGASQAICVLDARDPLPFQNAVKDLSHAFGSQLRIIDVENRALRPIAGVELANSADLANQLPADAFLLQRTSGSTGRPRLSVLSEDNILAGVSTYRQIWALTPNDTILVPLPISHSFGLIGGLLSGLYSGCRTGIAKSSEVPAVIQKASDDRATIILGSPEYYRILCALAPAFGNITLRLRLCLSSGEPLDLATAALVKRHLGAPVAQVYGSTETGIIAGTWPDPQLYAPGSVGRLVPDVEVRMTQGERQNGSGGGKLEVKTPALQIAYVDFVEGRIIPTADPWWSMADLAIVEGDGQIRLMGRDSGFVNIGGEKVNMHDIALYLRKHPAVSDAHVFAKVGQDQREVIAALVFSRDPSLEPQLVEQLRQHCRTALGASMVPQLLKIVRQSFRTETGKVPIDRLF